MAIVFLTGASASLPYIQDVKDILSRHTLYQNNFVYRFNWFEQIAH